MTETSPTLAALLALHQEREPVRNINKDLAARLSRLDRFAVTITDKVGTMGFFLIIFAWTLLWLGWNVAAPVAMRFDPPMGFVLWLFISNVIQLFLMPLIMVGQNIQGGYAEARAENDYKVNMRAEQEINLVLQHLEYQNGVLNTMMARMEQISAMQGRKDWETN